MVKRINWINRLALPHSLTYDMTAYLRKYRLRLVDLVNVFVFLCPSVFELLPDSLSCVGGCLKTGTPSTRAGYIHRKYIWKNITENLRQYPFTRCWLPSPLRQNCCVFERKTGT